MSNYLAIATVTAVLQRTLQASIQLDVDNARVTTVKPSNLGSGTSETGVNLFLYHVTPNHIWTKHNGHAHREPNRQPSKRSQRGLDLYYLLSFYGNEVELEPQCLLGSVVRTLQDYSTINQQMIQDAVADSSFSFLADSDLANQVELIKIEPLDLSLEDLSKVWSVLFQTPYNLSVAYQTSVVLIDGAESAQKALPVGEYKPLLVPFMAQPMVEKVVSQAGVYQPILADSSLMIRGQRLKGDVTHVRIGDVVVTPEQVSEKQIVLPLSLVAADELRAGVQRLQVVHQVMTGIPPAPRGRVESNAVAVVVRPTIIQVKVSKIQGSGDELRSLEVSIKVNLKIAKGQQVVLLLNERSSNDPVGYMFEASKRRQEKTNLIKFVISGIKAGEYLARVQVDGAESILSVDTNPDSQTFNQYISPKIVIRNR